MSQQTRGALQTVINTNLADNTSRAITPALHREVETNLNDSAFNKLSDTFNDISGTLALTKGGTGQPTANAALNALLPDQTGNNGKVLATNGTNTSWTTQTTQYTDEMAQDAVGGILVDTATIDLTYTDAAPEITASVKQDSITNALLANVSTATFKGRISGGSGDPEDLSGTQATTLLDNFVGDSGGGGTKGLVLAPAAGDGAALKFLKADGTWSTVPTANSVSNLDGTLTISPTTGVVIASRAAITGDVSVPVGSNTATLPTVNANVGTFGSATQVSQVTLNAKGQVTAGSNVSIQIAESQVTNLVSDLAGKQATGNYITALTGDVTASGPGSVAATLASNFKISSFGITIDGSGTAITTGSKGYVTVPFGMTITGWTLLADQSGSIVIDVKKSTYGGFPTTASIAGSEKPTLSAVQNNRDLSLSTWTTAVTAGDVIEFVVDSAATVTRVNLTVQGTRT